MSKASQETQDSKNPDISDEALDVILRPKNKSTPAAEGLEDGVTELHPAMNQKMSHL